MLHINCLILNILWEVDSIILILKLRNEASESFKNIGKSPKLVRKPVTQIWAFNTQRGAPAPMGSQWTWLTFPLLFSKWGAGPRHSGLRTCRNSACMVVATWKTRERGQGRSWCAGQCRSVPDVLAGRGLSNLTLSSPGCSGSEPSWTRCCVPFVGFVWLSLWKSQMCLAFFVKIYIKEMKQER